MRRSTSRRAAGLPEAAGEILASLALHRALSTPQVGELHLPGRSASWVQSVLARLRAAGLAAYVQTAAAPRRLWYVTEAGMRAAQGAGLLEEPPRPLTAEQVAGPLWRHTHAVNEAAISFVRAGRERGDEMGPLAWRHEVAHPLRAARGRRGALLISDAVLTYLRSAGGRVYVEQRFLEVDRATLSVDRLAAELGRYAELHAASDPDGEPLWRRRYPAFPGILCVLGGAPAEPLRRRRKVATALLRADPLLSREPEVSIRFCLAAELAGRGPFAPIFTEVGGEPGALVDWLGAPGEGEGERR